MKRLLPSCLRNKLSMFFFSFFQDDPNKNFIIFQSISFQMILPTWPEQPERGKVGARNERDGWISTKPYNSIW